MYKSLNQNLLLYILLLLPFTFIIGIAITEITVVIMTLFFFYKIEVSNLYEMENLFFINFLYLYWN